MSADDMMVWLRQMLEVEAREAQGTLDHNAGRGMLYDAQNEYARRRLRLAEAHRRIIEHYEADVSWSRDPACPDHERAAYWEHAGGMRDAVKHLASVYSDMPGYRQEWLP